MIFLYYIFSTTLFSVLLRWSRQHGPLTNEMPSCLRKCLQGTPPWGNITILGRDRRGELHRPCAAREFGGSWIAPVPPGQTHKSKGREFILRFCGRDQTGSFVPGKSCLRKINDF